VKGDALLVAAYEFTYAPVLRALKAASARGVDVRIVYEAGKQKVKGKLVATEATKNNKKAIDKIGFGAKTKLIPRTLRKAIPHNKFIVRLTGGEEASAVWTGSTNFSNSGFLGQTNVGHQVNDAAVAKQFLKYWKLLSKDPEPDFLVEKLAALTRDPGAELPKRSTTCLFSPRSSSAMLDWYAARILGANGMIMYTGGFGVTEKLAPALGKDRDFLRFILLEKPPTQKAAKLLGSDRDLVVVYGNVLGEIWTKNKKGELTLRRPIPGFELEKWFLHEELFRKFGNIFFVHSKILMIDPLSDDPLVFTGSANFSPPSLTANDENMLLVRGDTRIADIYMTEIDRILRHFYFRNIAAKLHGDGDDKAKFLAEDDSWVKPYFTDGAFKDRRRRMFF
jgi:phosphatidylserine/phosphatidylglycerophosphate/cardiolipin synthase-like enzyme